MEIPRDNIISRENDLGMQADGGGTFVDFADKPIPAGITITKYRGGITTHFPALLHAMLTRAEGDGYQNICSWHSHGRSFLVHNRQKFVKEVMPKFFRQTQFASFQRQLNLYGFQRISNNGTTESGAYYHAMFLRTRYDLCPAIQRSTEKELRERKQDDKSRGFEPDFGSMRPMPAIEEKHLTQARSVTNPQRNEPGTASTVVPKTSPRPSRPQSTSAAAAPAAMSLKPEALIDMPGLPKEDLVDNTFDSLFADQEVSRNEDDGVDKAYSSLFLDQAEPDMSWMEPRPIAPDAEEMLQNTTAVLAGSVSIPRNVGATAEMNPFFNPTRLYQPIEQGRKASARKRHEDLLVDTAVQPAYVSSATHPAPNDKKPKPKRTRAEPHNAGVAALSCNEQDEGMASFLDDVDLSDEDECSQPQHLKNAVSGPKALVSVFDASTPVSKRQNRKEGHCVNRKLVPVAAPSSLVDESFSPLKLPRSFRFMSKFSTDKPLVVTRAHAPFTIVFVNSRLELEFEMPRQSLMDTALRSYCTPSSQAALSSTAQTVRTIQGSQTGVQLRLSPSPERHLSCLATVGPFFMEEDLLEIHEIEYLVWLFHIER